MIIARPSTLTLGAALLFTACASTEPSQDKHAEAQPAPAAAPELVQPEPPPPELVCKHLVELLSRSPEGTARDLEQERATCLESAQQSAAEQPERYMADSYCTLLSSSAEQLGRCAEDPRSVPCLRAADRIAVLYYQSLEAEGSDEEAHTTQAAVEHDRVLFACLAEGFDFASLDCALAATQHAELAGCGWG